MFGDFEETLMMAVVKSHSFSNISFDSFKTQEYNFSGRIQLVFEHIEIKVGDLEGKKVVFYISNPWLASTFLLGFSQTWPDLATV